MKFEFNIEYVNYLLKYFDMDEQNEESSSSDLEEILNKAIKMFNGLKNNSSLPSNIKRNSRKSINAFFKK